MKKLLTLILCLSLVFVLSGLLPVHGEAEIYDKVIRLHVVANSDSEQDQALKLAVRDAVIESQRLICADCVTTEQARAALSSRLGDIKLCATEEIRRQGYDYPVRVILGDESYPTRSYGALCFPSGEYLSLRVLIGEAEGQNWWCVLFPPLCLSAASSVSGNQDAFVSVGLTPEQYKVITESDDPVYQARFKILEVLDDLF